MNFTEPVSEPLPLEDLPSSEGESEVSRLWVGNLDPKISEYQVIKILQKYGTVKKFDFLFHKSGPLEGQPRGYCFVTYSSREEAECSMRALDGKLALSRKLSVKWAHSEGLHQEILQAKPISSSSILKTSNDISLQCKIRAIEAKLKLMEQNNDIELISPPVIAPNSLRKKDKSRRRPYQKFRNLRR